MSRSHSASSPGKPSRSHPGLPLNIRDKIFDPFFSTKEVGKGRGQGLFLVHGVITEKHRGSIRLETVVGVGSTFAIRLPLAYDSGKTTRHEKNTVC